MAHQRGTTEKKCTSCAAEHLACTFESRENGILVRVVRPIGDIFLWKSSVGAELGFGLPAHK